MTFYHFYLPFSSIMLPLIFLAACEKERKIQCGGKKAPSEEHIGHCDSYFFLLCKRDKRQPGGKSWVNKSDESSYSIIRLHENKSDQFSHLKVLMLDCDSKITEKRKKKSRKWSLCCPEIRRGSVWLCPDVVKDTFIMWSFLSLILREQQRAVHQYRRALGHIIAI